MFRWRRYDASFWAVVARGPQLFRVTVTHVNGFTPAFFPADDDCGSVVTVEPVMGGNRLRRLSSLEPPLSAASTIAFRHTLILAEPPSWMQEGPGAECRKM